MTEAVRIGSNPLGQRTRDSRCCFRFGRQLSCTPDLVRSPMRTSPSITLLAIAVMAFVGCRHAPVIETHATEAVISVEERNTIFRVISPQSGKEITPGVDIYADGRCVVRTSDGQEFEKKLQSADIRRLLKFFDHQGLFSISDESIERAIDRELEPVRTELPGGGVMVSTRGRVCVVDASFTRIAARTPAKEVDIWRYALKVELDEYRTVTELRTVQRCIERVYDIARKID
jgi:hypothetical protein